MLTVDKCKILFGSTQEKVEGQLKWMFFLGHKVSVHQKVYSAFIDVDNDVKILQQGIRDGNGKTISNFIYQFNVVQTYCWRFQREIEPPVLSKHSFAIAVDINPNKNPMGIKLITDIPQSVINIFLKRGFIWGGNWEHRKDPMHFEFSNESLLSI